MPSALAVAKCLLDIAREDGAPEPSFVRIQKLVYFAHGLFLALNDKPLIEEQLEAWVWGPIFPSLYYGLFGRDISQVLANGPVVEDEDVLAFIKPLDKILRPLSTTQLSVIAHRKGSPWYEVVTTKTGSPDTSVEFLKRYLPPGLVIDRESVRQHFAHLKKDDSHGREAG